MSNMSTQDLVTEPDLMDWLGIHKHTLLEKRLRELKIPYIYGAKGKICTTQAAIDYALLGKEPEKYEPIEFVKW